MEKYEIKSYKLLKELMQDYFTSLGSGENKIAWCTSVGPAELLRSFGFEVYFPENHGALMGATRTATEYIPVAAKYGFSNQICSYTTSDIGAFISKETPLKKHYGLEGIPKPDLLVYNTNQCREVQDWFTFYANNFKVPIVGIHPPRYLDEVTQNNINQVVDEFKRIIPVCEKASGCKFDIDRFKETIKLSREATDLWQKVLKTSAQAVPAISFFDGTIHMGPIVVLRGTEHAKNYYETLYSELSTNNENGRGFIGDVKCRIFWDGMPIWGKLRMLSELFKNNNAAVVASTYCNSWIFDDFDEDNPFESSALAYTKIFINRSEKAKIEMLKNWVDEYNADGVIFHDSKTCFNNANTRFGMPGRFKEQTGTPVLVIEGDLCDLRFFSEGQSISKIETFVEQLEYYKINSRVN
jgi:benzoyl-CoA reductase/2-hydroxyglutaryl-CoA dehydratase subunit BcrC/BadD/HgdB